MLNKAICSASFGRCSWSTVSDGAIKKRSPCGDPSLRIRLDSGLAADGDAAGVDDADTDGLEYRPAEAEAVHLVVWYDFDVLADWHDADHVGLSATEDAAERNKLADDDVGGEELGVEAGLEDLAVRDGVDFSSRGTTL